MAILPNITPHLASPEQFRNGLEFTERYYHRNGITLACEPGGFLSKPLQDAINAVYSDDARRSTTASSATARASPRIQPNDPTSLLARDRKVSNWGKGRTWYLPKQVKLFTDGAIYSQLMQMKDGYTDGHHGAWIMDPPVFDLCSRPTGTPATRSTSTTTATPAWTCCSARSKSDERAPRQDHRTVLVHFGFAATGQVDGAGSSWAASSAPTPTTSPPWPGATPSSASAPSGPRTWCRWATC